MAAAKSLSIDSVWNNLTGFLDPNVLKKQGILPKTHRILVDRINYYTSFVDHVV